MQPHITQTSIKRRRPHLKRSASDQDQLDIGITLTTRAEFRHVLPEVLRYLGAQSLRQEGYEGIPCMHNSRRRQRIAERAADITAFQQIITDDPSTVALRTFDLSYDEVESAAMALQSPGLSLAPDVIAARQRIGSNMLSCIGEVLRGMYVDELPGNLPRPVVTEVLMSPMVEQLPILDASVSALV